MSVLLRNVCAFASAMTFLLGASLAHAQSFPIVKVEEDWELIVRDGNPEISAPQIVTYMTPNSSFGDNYFQFAMNHGVYPKFSSGNMQVLAYTNEKVSNYQTPTSHGSLAKGRERVTWTQRMEKSNHGLTFSIVAGNGRSYGQFGSSFSTTAFMTTFSSSLDSYSVQDSKQYAKIEFSGNRVDSFKLVRVRIYRSNGNVATETLNYQVKK